MSIKKSVNEQTQTVSFDFDGKGNIIADLSRIPAHIVTKLALHGLSQKMGDAYASNNGAMDAKGKAEEVYNGLLAGQWNTGKSGGGGDLVEALMMVASKGREDCAAKISGMTEEERKALRKNAKIASALLTIKAKRAAERAAAVVTDDSGDDLESLFA